MEAELWQGVKNPEAEYRELLGRVCAFLSLPSQERALRLIGAQSFDGFQRGKEEEIMRYLRKNPSFLSPFEENWDKGFSLSADGVMWGLRGGSVLGVAYSPAFLSGKRFGGDVLALSPSHDNLYFFVGDGISCSDFEPPSQLENFRREIEGKTGVVISGTDELLAILLQSQPISKFFGTPNIFRELNFALRSDLSKIIPYNIDNYTHAIPGFVAVAGKIDRDFIDLQGTGGDVGVAVLARDGSFIISPSSFLVGSRIDRITKAIMRIAREESGEKGPLWRFSKNHAVVRWRKATYLEKFGEIVGVLNGSLAFENSLCGWRIILPTRLVSGLVVYTDGFTNGIPQAEREPFLRSFLNFDVRGFRTRRVVERRRRLEEEMIKTRKCPPEMEEGEKPTDDVALVAISLVDDDAVDVILEENFSPEEISRILGEERRMEERGKFRIRQK